MPPHNSDLARVTLQFNNNARDHALRNAERFGELLSVGRREG
jgi:hypothetical protein